MRERASIGVRVKSGSAIAVLLGGTSSDPRVLDRDVLQLADPAVPGSFQPYHAAFATHRHNTADEVARLVKIVEQFGERSTTTLLARYRAAHDLIALGLVVGSEGDPARIKNDHIRAHAEEGRLFRMVIEGAAVAARVPAFVFVEKHLWATASATLGTPEATLKTRVAALGRLVDGEWRADHKCATLAAWMMLRRDA